MLVLMLPYVEKKFKYAEVGGRYQDNSQTEMSKDKSGEQRLNLSRS